MMSIKPIKVNRYWVYRDLWSRTWTSDISQRSALNDRNTQDRFIDRYLVPHVQPSRYPEHERYRHKLKESLRYYLNIMNSETTEELTEEWNDRFIPFQLPYDVHAFLYHIWERLFPTESWEIALLDWYVDLNDPLIPILMPSPRS
ncbi:hypothetical protein [Herpetosiphon sp. NSE202]|uniref:hypothetical protein n=1 Tax=Herpetosiphon sp. NSE202 TaxID=3351349 RepID=UPI00362E492A